MKSDSEYPASERLFGIVTLDSDQPFSKDERKALMFAIMECLLEEGALARLGMLLNRYESTVQHFEKQVARQSL